MNLRATRTVTWTVPAGRSAVLAAQEITVLDAISAPTPEQTNRRVDLAAGLPLLEELRITVSTCSALDDARYRANVQQANDWIAERAGRTVREILDDTTGAARVDRMTIDAGLAWSLILASARRVETRQRPMLENATADDPPWTEIDLPAEWQTPGGFLDAVPADLSDALQVAAHECNPGLWLTRLDANSKNYGGVSVS